MLRFDWMPFLINFLIISVYRIEEVCLSVHEVDRQVLTIHIDKQILSLQSGRVLDYFPSPTWRSKLGVRGV